MYFRPLTLVPYQLKMMNLNLLTFEEIDYLNYYHTLVRNEITNEIQNQNLKDGDKIINWLEINTATIIKNSSGMVSFPVSILMLIMVVKP